MKKTNLFWATILCLGALAGFSTTTMLGQLFKDSQVTAQTLPNQEKQTNLAENLKPIPLDHEQATEFLDVRGVGDAGMALTYKQPLSLDQTLPQGGLANFGQRLDALDPTGKSYRGDLSFINWETAVGTRCNSFRGRPSRSSYAFVSHPDNLREAYLRGFNLIGLANNHSWDCNSGENGLYSSVMTAQNMTRLSQEMNADWIWHGVGSQKAVAQVRTMNVKGKQIRVAFASLYMGGACNNITCISDKNAVLRSLRDANADLRVLSIHSWNSSTQQQLVNAGIEFIRSYNGDVVFGHGPHVWAPVRIVQSNSGKKGVMFESLGNFIHPNLAAKRKDMIGRALFDLETLQLRQVQAIPVNVNAAVAKFDNAPNPASIPTNNFSWSAINDPSWQSGTSPSVRGVYTNVK
ncbi:MAG: CapA family protein [Oscillatoria sp. PMC 1051.18]|nr:CapA family protein [Oscillatoria sp. PMC 1050.18]MEC5028964.1 CapA family protein [Oscillatoria sp. PMC 1051.18]